MRTFARSAFASAAVAVAFFATGCDQRAPGRAQPLPTVSPLPSPSPAGPIAAVAPTGSVDTLAQVRVRFTDDLIALQRLESPDEAPILAHFSLEPAFPGKFRFLTPRMIGFEPDRAWPPATRVRVTIAKGITDVHGHTLDADVSWTFQTPEVELSDLPGQNGTADTTPRVKTHEALRALRIGIGEDI